MSVPVCNSGARRFRRRSEASSVPASIPARVHGLRGIARIRHVLTANDEYLPEIGKYNAGQKFVFWSQFVLVGTLLVTGIGLWEAGLGYFENLLGFKATIEQKRWAASSTRRRLCWQSPSGSFTSMLRPGCAAPSAP
jgi:hypothetical protein